MITYYDSPFGVIELRANEQNRLTHLYFINKNKIAADKILSAPNKQNVNSTVLIKTIAQLKAYFTGQRVSFDLPLAPQGTKFQQEVWQALQCVSYGETQNYAWLAQKINHAKAVRAVGRANGANPIAIIIPCHRIIGANGSLTGYAGGLALKKHLLTLENAAFTAPTPSTKKA